MKSATQSENPWKSWIYEHPRLVLGLILVACLGPFINKAIHVDDPLFVWTGQWIQKHPANFFGFEVNWWYSALPMWVANCNPPLMSYYLAGVASVFGWHEVGLHLGCLGLAFAAVAGIYALAERWCEQPLAAAVIALFTPVFLVSSTTLMCDVLMLAFWVWAVVLWERALAGRQRWWEFIGAGVLAGLAVLSKYSAVTLLPLLPIVAVLRRRKAGWWLLGLAVPLLMVGGYEWMTSEMYGEGLLSAATHYAQTRRIELPGGWMAKGIVGLAFAGGTLLPLLFFAPWLWGRRRLWAGGVVIFGLWVGMFAGWNHLGLSNVPDFPALRHWEYVLEVALLTAGGLHLLLLAAAEIWRRRDIISATLVLWLGSGLFFAIGLNWTVSARSYLPLVPAAAILLVRRLGARQGNFVAGVGWVWPLVPAAAITLSLAIADYQLANSARTAAEEIAAKDKPAGGQLWFEGHWGFQYYMEKLGGRRVDIERSSLQEGDVLVVPWFNSGFVELPPYSAGWIETFEFRPYSWMNLFGTAGSEAAGFYSADIGPVPFAIGKLPLQDYFVAKIFSRVQFKTQPINRREVEAGGVPDFSKLAISTERQTAFQAAMAAAYEQALPGSRLERDGKIAEAIQCYRGVLRTTPDNPVALNNLAWLLATARQPELRNGEEAVRLAIQAVTLTDYREPHCMGTLAAAFARSGQFPEAVEATAAADILAQMTDQSEAAAKDAKLLKLYAAGRTLDTPDGP